MIFCFLELSLSPDMLENSVKTFKMIKRNYIDDNPFSLLLAEKYHLRFDREILWSFPLLHDGRGAKLKRTETFFIFVVFVFVFQLI